MEVRRHAGCSQRANKGEPAGPHPGRQAGPELAGAARAWRWQTAALPGLHPWRSSPPRPAREQCSGASARACAFWQVARLRSPRCRPIAHPAGHPLQGLTIRQQAQLISQATVLIHMHGAATGNLPFLPRGAQVVLLGPIPHRWPPLFGNILVSAAHGGMGARRRQTASWRCRWWPTVVASSAVCLEPRPSAGSSAPFGLQQGCHALPRPALPCPPWSRLGTCRA